jgi:hypothetical protein
VESQTKKTPLESAHYAMSVVRRAFWFDVAWNLSIFALQIWALITGWGNWYVAFPAFVMVIIVYVQWQSILGYMDVRVHHAKMVEMLGVLDEQSRR